MPLLVRHLRVADLPALEALERRRAARQKSMDTWLAGFRKLVERTLSEEPEGLLIAELDGAVQGLAVVRQRGRHPASGLKFGQLLHLLASEAHALVAQRLLREAEAYLKSRGCEQVLLSLPVDDPTHTELFKSSGYRVAAWELEKAL